MIRRAAGLYCGLVKACWMRASSTSLFSMTSRMSGTERKEGLSFSVIQYES